jgi:hypothetical protein
MPIVGSPKRRYSTTDVPSPTSKYVTNPYGLLLLPPTSFPSQLHLLLDDAEIQGFSHVVSWLERGTMFKVHKTKEFADHIMPCYFKNQTRYKSFQRQLNCYRFHRFDAGNVKGACFHALFMRDQPDLCTHINRVKVPRGGPPGVVQKQTLLLDHYAPPSSKALRLVSSAVECSEADVPDNFLRMFNSTEVDPLECPSATIFDDEEDDGLMKFLTTFEAGPRFRDQPSRPRVN